MLTLAIALTASAAAGPVADAMDGHLQRLIYNDYGCGQIAGIARDLYGASCDELPLPERGAHGWVCMGLVEEYCDVSADEWTIGNHEEFADSSSHSPNYLLGSLITVEEEVAVQALAVIGKAAGDRFVLGLYDDDGGQPGELVVQSAEEYVKEGVIEIAVDPVVIPAGDYYIMGIFETTSSVGIEYGGSETVWYCSLSYTDALPSPACSGYSTYTGQIFNYYIVVSD